MDRVSQLFALTLYKHRPQVQVVPTTRQCVVNVDLGARRSSVVRAFAHGAMGRLIDHSWGGPIELFFVPARAPRLV